MPEFTADIQIWCTCGDGLCGQTEAVMNKKHGYQEGFRVEVCENCLATAETKGHAEGHKLGYEEGYEAAMKEIDSESADG